MQCKQVNRNRRGFTLLEIMIVLTLIGIIVSFAGRKLMGSLSKGKVQSSKIIIKQLEGDLDRYRLDCNRYPSTAQGLKALITAPAEAPTCKNYDPNSYLEGKKSPPTDAWGNDLVYTCEDGQHYIIKSLGADGVEGGDGENKDISSADD